MSFKEKIKTLMSVGIRNTFRMNLKYFGWKGVFHQYILCCKKLKIRELNGKIESGVPLRRGIIAIGFTDSGVCDKKYERAMWQNSGVIHINGSVRFGQGARIVNFGRLEIGDGFRITANASIICYKKIVFGSGVLIGWDTQIMDCDMHKIYARGDNTRLNEPKEIYIGDRVWICCRALILKGSKIPNGSVVAAGSVVTGGVAEENCIVGDKGAIIKRNIEWAE